MKIGIIVHSRTGNTLLVAEKLKEALLAEGHRVELERVTAVDEQVSAAGKVELKTKPDTAPYDVLIFGAPVNAFSLSTVMKAYLAQLPTLKGKKVGCFVTQSFPYAWMGGNRTIRKMKEACKSKDVDVFETGIVNWSHKEREGKIARVLAKLSKV